MRPLPPVIHLLATDRHRSRYIAYHLPKPMRTTDAGKAEFELSGVRRPQHGQDVTL